MTFFSTERILCVAAHNMQESFTYGSVQTRESATGSVDPVTLQRMGELIDQFKIECQPGRGSTFHISLRFLLVQEPPTVRRAAVEHLEGMSVLVVDDNSTNRRIFEELLQSWCMMPTLVDSGNVAIEALAQQTAADTPFDIVILDSMMSGMGGFEVARQIQSRSDVTCKAVMMPGNH